MDRAPTLPLRVATDYASWFACLADPTRIRVLHTVAATADGITVGVLAERVGISQATCSHHVKKLADTGFVRLRKEATTTRITVNPACCVELPLAADVVMGTMTTPARAGAEPPGDIAIRAATERDWPAIGQLCRQGIATDAPDHGWLPGHRWVAQHADRVVGWAAVSPVSTRRCYAGVGETTVVVADGFRNRRIGTALITHLTAAADRAGLWTLQTTLFPDDKPGLALHRAAGYRTVGIRDRIARHDGRWRDLVLMERRSTRT